MAVEEFGRKPEDKDIGDEYLDKFRLTAEHKEKIRESFNALIERQFEAMEDTYLGLFRELPREVAENMSPQEAAQYVDMVVKAATENITKGASLLHKEAANVAKDEAKIAQLRAEFLESLGYKERK